MSENPAPNQTKSSTQLLLAYLAQQHVGSTVTCLMKMAYLIDLTSVNKIDAQISDFEYMRYNFGPFDKKIYDVLNELVCLGVLKSKAVYSGVGEYTVYDYTDVGECDLRSKFNEEQLGIIDSVLEAVAGYGAKILTDIAYKTKPMIAIGATQGGNENMGVVLDLRVK